MPQSPRAYLRLLLQAVPSATPARRRARSGTRLPDPPPLARPRLGALLRASAHRPPSPAQATLRLRQAVTLVRAVWYLLPAEVPHRRLDATPSQAGAPLRVLVWLRADLRQGPVPPLLPPPTQAVRFLGPFGPSLRLRFGPPHLRKRALQRLLPTGPNPRHDHSTATSRNRPFGVSVLVLQRPSGQFQGLVLQLLPTPAPERFLGAATRARRGAKSFLRFCWTARAARG